MDQLCVDSANEQVEIGKIPDAIFIGFDLLFNFLDCIRVKTPMETLEKVLDFISKNSRFGPEFAETMRDKLREAAEPKAKLRLL